jgi:hypothetical protein
MVNAWFGIKPPDNYDGPAWGARAIFDEEPDEFSLVWDRSQGRGNIEALANLLQWFTTRGGKLLRAKMARECYTKRSSHLLEIRAEGFTLVANANGSCGYLYLGCWEDENGNN